MLTPCTSIFLQTNLHVKQVFRLSAYAPTLKPAMVSMSTPVILKLVYLTRLVVPDHERLPRVRIRYRYVHAFLVLNLHLDLVPSVSIAVTSSVQDLPFKEHMIT